MGLFNKKKSDDGRQAESTSRTQVIERREEAPHELPTEPMKTARSEAACPPRRARRPLPRPIRPRIWRRRSRRRPSRSSAGATRRRRPRSPRPIPTLSAEADEDQPVDEPDTGTVEKEELRRAVSGSVNKSRNGSTAEEEDDKRVSAEDLIGPMTPQRRHPFQPDPVVEQGERHDAGLRLRQPEGWRRETTTTLNLAVAFSKSGHRVL